MNVNAEPPTLARTTNNVDATIVALGGGGFSMSETGESAIDDYLLELATAVSARRSTEAHHRRGGGGAASLIPRVCFVPTASGDNPNYIDRFEAAFEGRAATHVLSLFGQGAWGYSDPQMLLDMDLIYVGGGSTANLLAVWRRHGVDEIMRIAAAAGTILAGISAGANCWFEGSSTDSFGPLAPLNDGLGFIPGSACPHYHGEVGRAETFRTWIESGRLPGPGLAIDDDAAVVFDNVTAASVIAESPAAHAYLVDGHDETRLGTDSAPDDVAGDASDDVAGTPCRQVPRRVLE